MHSGIDLTKMFPIELVQRHPALFLERHLYQLTERELEAAARAAPKTAFDLRYFAEGRRHAILLACSYPAALLKPRCTDDADFVHELKDSVLEHPRIWRKAHDRSFHTLFRGIEAALGIQFTGQQLLGLADSLGRNLRKELLDHIASGI
jgi:hypothetical protein